MRYRTGFWGEAVGAEPSGFTRRAGPDGWAVAVAGGEPLLRQSEVSAFCCLSWDLADDEADVELLARFRATDATPANYGAPIYLLARLSDPDPLTLTGYYAVVSADGSGHTLYLMRSQSGAGVVLGSASGTLVAGAWHWLRLRVVGSSLKATFWAEDQPEPGWAIEVSDGALSAGGWAGVGSYDVAGVRDYDFLALGTGGDEAPGFGGEGGVALVASVAGAGEARLLAAGALPWAANLTGLGTVVTGASGDARLGLSAAALGRAELTALGAVGVALGAESAAAVVVAASGELASALTERATGRTINGMSYDEMTAAFYTRLVSLVGAPTYYDAVPAGEQEGLVVVYYPVLAGPYERVYGEGAGGLGLEQVTVQVDVRRYGLPGRYQEAEAVWEAVKGVDGDVGGLRIARNADGRPPRLGESGLFGWHRFTLRAWSGAGVQERYALVGAGVYELPVDAAPPKIEMGSGYVLEFLLSAQTEDELVRQAGLLASAASGAEWLRRSRAGHGEGAWYYRRLEQSPLVRLERVPVANRSHQQRVTLELACAYERWTEGTKEGAAYDEAEKFDL